MKKLIQATLLLILTPTLALATLDQEIFIREKLITTPIEQSKIKGNIAIKIGSTTSIILLGRILGIRLTLGGYLTLIDKLLSIFSANKPAEDQQNAAVKKQVLHQAEFKTPIKVGLLESVLVYWIMHKIILTKIQKNNLIKFVKDWPLNKHYTPKQYHYLFDRAYLKYQKDKSLDANTITGLNKKLTLWINEKPQEGLTNDLDHKNWELLHDKLITAPQLQASTLEKKSSRLFGTLALILGEGVLLAFACDAITLLKSRYTMLEGMSLSIEPLFNRKALLLPIIISLCRTKYSYKYIGECILSNLEQTEFKKYIENWESNKESTPIELHTLLEDVYLKCKANPAEVDFAELTRIVKAFINNHYKAETVTNNLSN